MEKNKKNVYQKCYQLPETLWTSFNIIIFIVPIVLLEIQKGGKVCIFLEFSQ